VRGAPCLILFYRRHHTGAGSLCCISHRWHGCGSFALAALLDLFGSAGSTLVRPAITCSSVRSSAYAAHSDLGRPERFAHADQSDRPADVQYSSAMSVGPGVILFGASRAATLGAARDRTDALDVAQSAAGASREPHCRAGWPVWLLFSGLHGPLLSVTNGRCGRYHWLGCSFFISTSTARLCSAPRFAARRAERADGQWSSRMDRGTLLLECGADV